MAAASRARVVDDADAPAFELDDEAGREAPADVGVVGVALDGVDGREPLELARATRGT